MRRVLPWLCLSAAACGEAVAPGVGTSSSGAPADGDGSGKADRAGLPAYANVDRDVLATDLHLDLSTREGTAKLRLATAERRGATFAAQGLQLLSVESESGPLDYTVEGGRLHVDAPRGRWWTELTVRYRFEVQQDNDGWLAGGSTVLWPYHCGNLFPCDPSPADGLRFSLAVDGVPDGQTAIFPTSIDADAPPYQLALAVGDYTCEPLGETAAGTRVKTCYLPRGRTAALDGTRDLVEVFDWLERSLGPYVFGDEVGAVAVRWGASAAGGMEHHPYWHVDVSSMADPVTQAHEAAHGWFGDGVRIACWEDFVLSEGTVSYLTAKAIGGVKGPAAEAAVWADYELELADAIRYEDTVPWPEGCGTVDVLHDGLFSNVVYMKGAFFFRALERELGEAELRGVLSRFYEGRVGTAATFAELLAFVRAETGYDATPLASAWLRRDGPAPR